MPYEISDTLDVAIPNAARDAEASAVPEPVVLLSPACASFDQYRNFEIRGNRFRELVMALPGVKPAGVSTQSHSSVRFGGARQRLARSAARWREPGIQPSARASRFRVRAKGATPRKERGDVSALTLR